MKTTRLLILLIACISLSGCITYYHRIDTTIHNNGEIQKDIYSRSTNKGYENIKLASEWTIIKLDTLSDKSLFEFRKSTDFGGEYTIDTKASHIFKDIKQYKGSIAPVKEMQPSVMPKESFRKRFKWFYTEYTYECTYPSLADSVLIHPNTFFTEGEIQLWFSNNLRSYQDQGMTGADLYNLLDQFYQKRENYLRRTSNEIMYMVLSQQDQIAGGTFQKQIIAGKDSIFNRIESKEESCKDFECLVNLLDKHCQTDFFSSAYKNKKKVLEEELDKLEEKYITPIIEISQFLIENKLSMPGKIIKTNAFQQTRNTIVWEVSVDRLIMENYTIKAVSRKSHLLAFVITGLLIPFCISCFRRAYKMRK